MAQKVLFLAAKDIYQNLSQVISHTCLFVVPVDLQPLGALSKAETMCVCDLLVVHVSGRDFAYGKGP